MAVNPKAKYIITAEDETARAWKSAMSRADGGLKKMSGLMKGSLGGLGIAAFTTALGAGINKAIEYGDEIGKLAAKTGIGTEAISELAHAAKMNDIEIGALTTSLKKMQVEISKDADVFRDLGLSMADLKALDPDRQFELIADKIAGIRDPADRARAAVEAFGKAGTDLLPMFSNGAAGIRAAREEAVRLGHSMSGEAVKALQQGDDAIKQLSATWDSFMRKVAVGAVKIAQAMDIIDKDRVGELQDQIAAATEELRNASGSGFDQVTDTKRIEEATKALQRYNVELAYAISPGKTRSGQASVTNYGGGKKDPTAPTSFLNPQTMLEFEQNAAWLEGEAESTAEGFADAFKYGESVTDDAMDGIANSSKDMMDELERHFGEVGSVIEDTLGQSGKMSVYAEEAARNMQDHFANFLFDPFEDGLKGMLKGFADTIRRMLAEAAAAKVFESIFGKTESGGGNDAAGWLSTLFGAFGGGKAKGGPLESGKWYVAGERGPEPIWGGGSGAFAAGYPSGGGGNVTVVNENHFHEVRDVTDAKMAAYSQRISDGTVARMQDMKRRGKF